MFQILISTTDSKFLARLNNVPTDYLVINQLINDSACVGGPSVLSYRELGLARSRNRAIDMATGDICLISDDDVEYLPEIVSVIQLAFEENPDADIITFQIEAPDGRPFRRYRDSRFWHNKRSVMSVCSIEIAFRRRSVLAAGLRFDERFGLGSCFPTGEEIIFLCDAIDRGLRALSYPSPIVIHPLETSGARLRDNSRLIEAKGAMFFRIFGIYSYLVSLLFALKKYRGSGFGLFRFYATMLRGGEKFRQFI